ncbi:MAG: aminotransferase class IV [Clostridia bacterium]|nr:aminotransferase class IV [Clostridia bacterium]
MAYPLVESCILDSVYVNGKIYSIEDSDISWVKEPTDSMTYYETIRILNSRLLFIEDHLTRLKASVKGEEDFEFNADFVKSESVSFVKNMSDSGCDLKNANLRVVLTRDNLIIHICEANIPSDEQKKSGIVTRILNWERVAPNIKVFRGDYKQKVAETFSMDTSFGTPYEVLLTNNSGKLYEGSKSNLFVIVGDTVYSETDDKILIGITRKRVLEALNNSGLKLEYKTFTLDEIKQNNAAVFVSSTPFDILPVYSIDDTVIDSSANINLQKISKAYDEAVSNYMNK